MKTILDYIENGKHEGGRLITGGQRRTRATAISSSRP